MVPRPSLVHIWQLVCDDLCFQHMFQHHTRDSCLPLPLQSQRLVSVFETLKGHRRVTASHQVQSQAAGSMALYECTISREDIDTSERSGASGFRGYSSQHKDISDPTSTRANTECATVGSITGGRIVSARTKNAAGCACNRRGTISSLCGALQQELTCVAHWSMEASYSSIIRCAKC